MVEEFLPQSDLPVYLPRGMEVIINADHLATLLSDIKQQRERASCVLIVPPNISIAISMLHEKIIAYDSHRHSAFGVMIAYSEERNMQEFCRYLEVMIKKHFNSTLLQSNLIYVELLEQE